MTQFAVFGAGPFGALALEGGAARAPDPPALRTLLEVMARDRDGEPDVEWPPYSADGARAVAGLSDFTRLVVGPGLL